MVIVTAPSQLAFFVISIDYFVPLNPAELLQYSNTCILTPIKKHDKKEVWQFILYIEIFVPMNYWL